MECIRSHALYVKLRNSKIYPLSAIYYSQKKVSFISKNLGFFAHTQKLLINKPVGASGKK